jgi:hypothetical protein
VCSGSWRPLEFLSPRGSPGSPWSSARSPIKWPDHGRPLPGVIRHHSGTLGWRINSSGCQVLAPGHEGLMQPDAALDVRALRVDQRGRHDARFSRHVRIARLEDGAIASLDAFPGLALDAQRNVWHVLDDDPAPRVRRLGAVVLADEDGHIETGRHPRATSPDCRIVGSVCRSDHLSARPQLRHQIVGGECERRRHGDAGLLQNACCPYVASLE